MMEIGKTKTAAQPYKAMQGKLAKDRQPKARPGQGVENFLDVHLSTRAKVDAFLRVAKSESKDGFALQSGVAQRSVGEPLAQAPFTYNGKPIPELSQEEAQELIGPEGYFGVSKTAERLADFVLCAGGDSLQRLQAGRQGVEQGFREAEEAWGGTLPEISYQTLAKALEMIDARMKELAGE